MPTPEKGEKKVAPGGGESSPWEGGAKKSHWRRGETVQRNRGGKKPPWESLRLQWGGQKKRKQGRNFRKKGKGTYNGVSPRMNK